jgi:hypothetical protein
MNWGNEEEKRWINRIGRTHKTMKKSPLFTEKQLLEKYLAACRKRANWGVLSKDVIIGYLERRLECTK